MKRRQLMFPSDLSDSRPMRRPGHGWDPRYLIETTPSRLAHEAERGRELMAELDSKTPRGSAEAFAVHLTSAGHDFAIPV